MARAVGNTGREALSGRKTVSLALVVVLGAVLAVLIDPVIGLPVAAAALAGLVFGERTPVSLLAGLVAGVLAGALLYGVIAPLLGATVGSGEPYIYTAVLVVSLLLVAPITAWMMRRRSALETMIAVTTGLTALSVIELSVYAAQAGTSVNGYMESAVTDLFAQAGAADEMLQTFIDVWPGLLVAANAITALLVVVAVGIAGARFGAALRRIPPLAMLDLDVRVVILPIVAVALLAAGRIPVDIAPTLEIVGKNLLMIARMVYFLQGVAVFAGLYERAKFSRPVRMAGFVLLGVTEALVPAVSLTGLADMWLNLRRLPRDGNPPPVRTSSDDRTV